MKIITTSPSEASYLPILSSQAQGWDNILVEQFQHPPGEEKNHFSDEHAICMSLAPRPVRLLQIKGGRTYVGLHAKGDVSVTPAKTPHFARWESDDSCLQIRIACRFIQRVASETIATNPEQLELRLEFQTRDPQLEAIAMMLLAELRQERLGGRLYIESLANLLAVHLLRQYASPNPRPIVHESGLSERQILQVVDYVHEYLHQDIKLADLATLLNISESHFSHQFKQSIGITPYQYLLQQRVERAKKLLKESDASGTRGHERSISDIAFLCGFSSHSHLSKQFRQLVGITPTTYRAL